MQYVHKFVVRKLKTIFFKTIFYFGSTYAFISVTFCDLLQGNRGVVCGVVWCGVWCGVVWCDVYTQVYVMRLVL